VNRQGEIDQMTMKMTMTSNTSANSPLSQLRRVGLLVALAAACAALLAASPTQASAAADLKVDTWWAPQFMAPGGEAKLGLRIGNGGDAPVNSAGLSFEYQLPEAVKYTGAFTTTSGPPDPAFPGGVPKFSSCSGAGTSTISCSGLSAPLEALGTSVIMFFGVEVDPGAAEGLYDSTLTTTTPAQPAPIVVDRKMRVSQTPLDFGFDPDNIIAAAVDESGNDYVQAGGHPADGHAEVRLAMKLGFLFEQCTANGGTLQPTSCYEGASSIANIIATLPPGFVGDPGAAARCPEADFPNNCPPESQVGFVTIFAPAIPGSGNGAVYNMVPPPDAPAQFAFYVPWAGIQRINASVRADGDYGVTLAAEGITEAGVITRSNVAVWGSPHDPGHFEERCQTVHVFSLECEGGVSGTPQHSSMPNLAFLAMPTNCIDPPRTTLHIDRYEERAPKGVYSDPRWRKRTVEHPFHTGCENVPFDPAIDFELTSRQADSVSGLDVHLHIPRQNDRDPDGVIQSHLKKATVTLPEGVGISPTQADGVDACSPAQVGLVSAPGQPARFDNAEPQCPTASKVANARIETPLLENDLTGEIFLAEQFNNPFGSRYAIYMTVREPSILVKLPGLVEADPVTGQIKTTFDQNPQLPFEDLTINFFDGPRAALTTPTTCGAFSSESRFVPWSASNPYDPAPGDVAVRNDEVTVDAGANGSGCVSDPAARPLSPGFSAGALNPVAGAHSPVVIKLARPDGQQEIKGLQIDLPPGLTAKLKGIPYCSDDALARIDDPSRSAAQELAGSLCPAASRLGKAVVGAGPGPSPFEVEGQIYLTGPYKGAPLSVAVVTPAKAGPFDLGNVVVRSRLVIDPDDAEVHAISDELPHILEGIPVRLRTVAVVLDRDNFALNPTSCAEMRFGAKVTGGADLADPGDDVTVAVSDRFQVGECRALGFKPPISLRLYGGTGRAAHPAFEAVVRPRAGDANVSRAAVKLPRSAFLDQAHIRSICTRVQFAADNCPKAAAYGEAKAWSPLLDHPLEGPVYLRSSENNLPDLIADLRGPDHQPIRVELAGRIDSVKGGIRNTFDLVPDAPVSKFVLRMEGGKKGLITNSRNLCAKPSRALARLTAHNGRRYNFRPPVVAMSCEKAKKRKSKRAAHRRRGD
jgi:hypothetical protein